MIKLAADIVLPIRIFVNRQQLLQNNSQDTVFHAPLLSNNSIVCIKSPSTRIYLSNNDMLNLSSEIETEVLLIVYELTSPPLMQDVIKKLRMDQSMDWHKEVVSKLFQGHTESLVTSHIQSITRISKFKYKLHFKHNWELDIFVDNIKSLAHIRAYLLSRGEVPTYHPPLPMRSKRKVLLYEQVQTPPNLLSEEHPSVPDTSESEEDKKPELKFKYRPVINLGECINIHVLKRPQRYKKSKT